MDITPAIPAGRQVIERYGGGRFRVGGQDYQGSILILPERTLAWPVVRFEELAFESLQPALEAKPRPEFLLLGCGSRQALVPPDLRQAVRDRGPVIEAMDTGAACRTFNVLLAEGRLVAAALIAVD